MTSTKNRRVIEVAAAQHQKEREYWLKKLSAFSEKTRFPIDTPNLVSEKRELAEYRFTWDGRLYTRLLEVGNGKDQTLHIILLSGLSALLSRYLDREDILIGTSIYRQNTSGIWLNTLLAIGSRCTPVTTFKELLIQVKQSVIEAVKNQAYPLELLPESMPIEAEGEEFPLFDTGLILENIHDPGYFNDVHMNMLFCCLRTGGKIEISVRYNSNLYEHASIERIAAHFTRLLEQALGRLEIEIVGIDILSQQEKNRLLVEFNRTAVEYPREKRIQQLFTEKAGENFDKIALTGPGSPSLTEPDKVQLTYRGLLKLSEHLATALTTRGVGPEEIIGIMSERSVEMIVAVLGILMAGGGYLPLDPEYPKERIDFILTDSRAGIVLTRQEINEILGTELNMKRFSTSTPGASLAYIIYTSGTTGRPKGVMIEHRSVIRLVRNTGFLDFAANGRILQTGALEFDASTFEIWGVLLNGMTLCQIDKGEILDPAALKENILREGITVMWMTSSLFNRMVQEDVDIFAGIVALLVGGEALSPPHINKLREKYPRVKIINGYGPTENTTFSTTHSIEKNYRASIPIGKPITNSTAYIVDGKNRLKPMGVPGELVVGGDGLARGYMNNPELTAEKFIESSFLPTTASPFRNTVLYRTGDLAKWLKDGNIKFLGRLDRQVKVRGYRIELGEVESRLLRNVEIKDAAVGVKTIGNGNRVLTAYVVPHNHPENEAAKEETLRGFLAKGLPRFMIPDVIVFLKKLPLTPNGKIDWRRLPEPLAFEKNRGPGSLPRTNTERELAGLFAGILGIEEELIISDTHFFKSGGHSLKATQLIARIRKRFHVSIPIIDIFENPTVRALAKYIDDSAGKAYSFPRPVEKKEFYPLSAIQKRFFLVGQMEGIGLAYNLADVFVVEGRLEKGRLQQAFQQLIARHESLRTSFEVLAGQVVQRIHEQIEPEIEYYSSDRYEESDPANRPSVDGLIKKFIRPFDMSEPPLLRLGLLETGEKSCLLMIDVHHIVADGVSQEILYRDLLALYHRQKLPGLILQYKDFSQWQASPENREELERQSRYWLRRYEKKIPDADIFTDFMRPDNQSFTGKRMSFKLEHEIVEKINRLREETGTTLYMVILTLYTVLLSKYYGHEDIVVGTPVAGRHHESLENLIGLFINALPMRNFPRKELTFAQYLGQVKKDTLEAFANQNYPFDYLLEKLEVKPGMKRNPLFDVELVLLNMETSSLKTEEFELKPYDYELNSTQVDMALYASENRDEINFNLFYSVDLFKSKTIEDFIRYFKDLVETLTDNREIKLGDIKLSTQLQEIKTDIYNDLSLEKDF